MIQQVFTITDSINCMHLNESGIWFGHYGGLSFFDPESGKSTKWTTADGLPAHPILDVTTHQDRLAVATPNGIAWTDDYKNHAARSIEDERSPRWSRGLMNAEGSGAYINGVSFVDGKIYATTGGGRIYLEVDHAFQLLELPLQQARLLRVVPLEAASGSRRLLIVTNNSGVLLLATGQGEEPSLYQWGEDEGLASRYVTSIAHVGEYVVIGVHGCLHVARSSDLVNEPDGVSKWGSVVLGDLSGPSEHTRIHSLCEHRNHLYAASSAGLHRVLLDELELACQDRAVAHRVDEAPVRQVVSDGETLWGLQHTGFGYYLEGDKSPRSRTAQGHSTRSTIDKDLEAGGSQQILRPRIVSFGRRWRFVDEPRWCAEGTEPECHKVISMLSTLDGLILGGDLGQVVTHADGHWTTESVSRTRRAPDIHSLAIDPDSGHLWTATRFGLFLRDSRGHWHRDMNFPGRTVHQLIEWGGQMLALGSAGIHVFTQGAWSEVPIGESTCPLFMAAAGRAGLVLAGKPGSGFYLWQPDAAVPTPWHLPVGRANCMAWGEDGVLWVGTDDGLAAWDGHELTGFAWDGEKANHVTSLLVHNGKLYVGSQAGVWIAPMDFAAGNSDDLENKGKRFGLLEGLPHMLTMCMAMHEDSVWVGTQGGLVRFKVDLP